LKNENLKDTILFKEKVNNFRLNNITPDNYLSRNPEVNDYLLDNFSKKKIINSSEDNYFTRVKIKRKNLDKNVSINFNDNKLLSFNDDWSSFFKKQFDFKRKTQNFFFKKIWLNEFLDSNKIKIFRFSDFFENNAVVKRGFGSHSPLRIIKNTFITNNNTYDPDFNENFELLRFRFNDNNVSVNPKLPNNNQYLTLKQKRYSLKGKINAKNLDVFDYELAREKKLRWTPRLKDNQHFIDSPQNATRDYRLLKKNKVRQEVFPVQLNRRLLRTKRTLVLPAHVNLTAITNSYDVVHSWFIPGLGLKFDCVPGRTTHHTFFVENVGFYYGQCAEICGRYHHHMPIRVCALPFEHFLVWWNSFGLPKLLYTNNQKKFSSAYGFRKYVW